MSHIETDRCSIYSVELSFEWYWWVIQLLLEIILLPRWFEHEWKEFNIGFNEFSSSLRFLLVRFYFYPLFMWKDSIEIVIAAKISKQFRWILEKNGTDTWASAKIDEFVLQHSNVCISAQLERRPFLVKTVTFLAKYSCTEK